MFDVGDRVKANNFDISATIISVSQSAGNMYYTLKFDDGVTSRKWQDYELLLIEQSHPIPSIELDNTVLNWLELDRNE